MISSDKNPNIQRIQTEIAINQRLRGFAADQSSTTNKTASGMLPYDPTQPSDENVDPQVIAPNFLDNSDFDYSRKGYLNAGTADEDLECFNWYRQRFIKVVDAVITGAPSTNVSSAAGPFKATYTYPMDFVLLNGDTAGVALSGTLTRVDDNNATLSAPAQTDLVDGTLWFGTAIAENATNALKATGHSTFAANEGTNTKIPRWDKTNGWLEIGSDTVDTFDMACPLPINFVRGGLRFFFRCIVSLRSGATTNDPVRMSLGIWDATTAEKRFVESSNFDLSGTPVGTAGATTYNYIVIADLDDGRSIVSDLLTINTGNAVLSPTNYNRLTWDNAVGILRFKIYRETGGVVKRVFTITNGGHDYNDYGTDEGETPASLPTAGAVRPIAYVVSPAFNPSSGWQPILLQIDIPGTYDTSRTTGKQWMRAAIEGLAGSERMVLIDRIMLSTSNGGWGRSARDLNKILSQNPSSLPTSTTQGNTGIGHCFPLHVPVIACERDGSNLRSVPIGDTDKGDYVFSGANRVYLIEEIQDSFSDELVTFQLSNGIELPCTPRERFITSRADKRGTKIEDLTLGDAVLCWENGRVSTETIEHYVRTKERVKVRALRLRGGHTFVVGNGELKGAIAHNLKLPEDPV